jgi:hypothetical protein
METWREDTETKLNATHDTFEAHARILKETLAKHENQLTDLHPRVNPCFIKVANSAGCPGFFGERNEWVFSAVILAGKMSFWGKMGKIDNF